ncbi:MAG TPA: hypothetical protein VH763_07405 [Gemmatimonadales bacterium]|jgi:photosystem II stability/assembly factor-like uncharacterized protein
MNRTRRLGALLLALAGLSGGAGAQAQERAARGIWEPANYSEDLALRDVFFVTADIGWASGAAGTILHTSDGGKSWTPQLGGDPAGADDPIEQLRFVDERHGWAVQGKKLLRTVDGESWEEIGATPNAMASDGDYAFVSPTVGFALGTTTDIGYPDHVFQTRDGGHTWEPIAPCEVKATIEGLAKHFQCVPTRLHFPTPTVGYVLARECMGPSCGLPIVGKTADGGATWTFSLGPGELTDHTLKELFFTDERTGFIQSRQGISDKLYATTDGGATWRGVVATPGDWLRFADPEVGWSVDEHRLSYTASSGSRWSSQAHRFPATPRALSFPRRDRAYLVGDHGMIYRYRLVTGSAATTQGAMAAPAMPALASPLSSQAADIERTVSELQPALESAPDGGTAAPSGSGFAEGCCGKPVNKLNLILEQVAQSLPQFVARFKNTNLLQAGLRMLTILPGGLGDLKAAYLEFTKAPDKASAQAALAKLGAAAGSLRHSVKVALQEELPSPETSAAGDDASTTAAVTPTAEAAEPSQPSEAAEARTENAAAKTAKSLIKRKLRVP